MKNNSGISVFFTLTALLATSIAFTLNAMEYNSKSAQEKEYNDQNPQAAATNKQTNSVAYNEQATRALIDLIERNMRRTLVLADLENLSTQIKNLLEQGASLNHRYGERRALLYLVQRAIIENNLSLCDLLISHGADNSVVDNNENNLLHFASINASPQLTQYLIDKSVSINALNKEGHSPLVFAITERRLTEPTTHQVIELFINNGARLITTSAVRGTILHIPDITPTQFHLFLQLMLNELTIDWTRPESREALEQFLQETFDRQPKTDKKLIQRIYIIILEQVILKKAPVETIRWITELINDKKISPKTFLKNVHKALILAAELGDMDAFNTILSYFLEMVAEEDSDQSFAIIKDVIKFINAHLSQEDAMTAMHIVENATSNAYFTLLNDILPYNRRLPDRRLAVRLGLRAPTTTLVAGIPAEIVAMIVQYLTYSVARGNIK